MRNESSKADKTVTAEQPSPVSVLDAAFYKEDPPSPVKKISNISRKLGKQLRSNFVHQSHLKSRLVHKSHLSMALVYTKDLFHNIENSSSDSLYES